MQTAAVGLLDKRSVRTEGTGLYELEKVGLRMGLAALVAFVRSEERVTGSFYSSEGGARGGPRRVVERQEDGSKAAGRLIV